jgi:hypothetical protein
MAIKTDDIDIRDVRMYTELGGNGDIYINLTELDKKLFGGGGGLFHQDTTISFRVATSGSSTPHEIMMTLVQLHQLLEKYGLNKKPQEEGR